MLTEERQAYILDRINKFNTVKLKDLVIELGASESTIRRDFDDLEDKGLIKRVHGGAVSIDGAFTFDNTIIERSERALSEKIAIGRCCGDLVKDGDFIYIDAGTTCYEIIPFLRGKDIVVVTNGIHNIDRLLDNNIKTYILGGYVKPMTKALIGEEAILEMGKYRFTKAFIGANGISANSSITTPDISEANIKAEAIRRSKDVYVVIDSSKFGKVSFAKICDLDEVSIITDAKKEGIDKRIVENTRIISVE
ncbi:MAG: DeoR/GlpR transcriptional regulator [Peptostreptococcus sp.]|jgi:transcriptional regulator, deoR family|uniref:DeoR/GlpR family DNA-binding transcription regulator n=2 Tax=Peptostreptococcaceae TaxID=186804 RepID=UPI001CB41693|nr:MULTISPECIES: DeoR/GlpR family DNA-binding transcription regulator [Peptostreptococcus]MBF1045066.1 DeoR/GlpR transcriptional regulator [Peptostreptococcus sp.]MBF1052332.1 DeoR/GlpR transcriptional regulator [Peptostreptococcus sp.]